MRRTSRRADRLSGDQHGQRQVPRLCKRTGAILDALVAEGANQINGPNLTIDKPEAALDEARAKAIANGRARADSMPGRWACGSCGCCRSARAAAIRAAADADGAWRRGRSGRAARPKIDPGEQKLQVSVSMSFELQ